MGLDSYVYAVKKAFVVNDFTVKESINTKPVEVRYWRDNKVFHRWVQLLNESKGGTELVYLRITEEDLNNLNKYLLEVAKEEEFDKYVWEDYASFLISAKGYLNNDYALYYWSW